MKVVIVSSAAFTVLVSLLSSTSQRVTSLEAAVGKEVPDEKNIFTEDHMVEDDFGSVDNEPHDQNHLPEHDTQIQARTTAVEVEEFDDRTYLDLFGEKAKEFLTQKLIPTTDLECQWNWKHGRCEPLCMCSYQPKRGDFHLGRTCRRVPADHSDSCESLQSGPSFPAFPTPMVQAMIQKIRSRSAIIQRQVATRFDTVYGRIQEQVCQDVQQRCGMDDTDNMVVNDGQPVFAWQEKLFCKEYINDCVTGV
jgi:hypothetical protein